MANTFVQPSVVARMVLGLLERELVLPKLVTRMGIEEFRGADNDTVNVRIPAYTTAREQTWRSGSSITLDDLTETSFPVQLTKHPYSAVAIQDEELTLDIVSFADQVLRPQIRAVAEKLESYVYAAMTGADYHWATISIGVGDSPGGGGSDYDADAKDVLVAINEANRRLNVKNVPRSDRFIVLGADLEAVLLNGSQLLDAGFAGNDDALRDAMVGRLYGMPVISTNSIPSGEAYVFHKSAFILATVAPVVPDGVVTGATATLDGLSVRWIRDYDPTTLRDRSVVSAFAGYASVEEDPDRSNAVGDQLENIRAIKIAASGS